MLVSVRPCPRCREQLRVPPVDAPGTLRCFKCGERFAIGPASTPRQEEKPAEALGEKVVGKFKQWFNIHGVSVDLQIVPRISPRGGRLKGTVELSCGQERLVKAVICGIYRTETYLGSIGPDGWRRSCLGSWSFPQMLRLQSNSRRSLPFEIAYGPIQVSDGITGAIGQFYAFPALRIWDRLFFEVSCTVEGAAITPGQKVPLIIDD